jgi:hypothetical protein
MEQRPAARDAIAQILTNSRMCAEGHRPIGSLALLHGPHYSTRLVENRVDSA